MVVMARTSKTKVGGGPDMRLANEAKRGETADSSRATDRAEAQRAQYQQSTEQGIRHATDQIVAQEEAQKGRDFQAQQAEQDRGLRREQMAQQSQQFGMEQEQRQQEMQQRGDLSREQMQLQGAQHGLMQNPELQRRQAALEAEMQRGQEQTGKPTEFDGQSWIQTPEAKEGSKFQQETQRIRAETERSRVQAIQSNAKTAARTAQLKGDQEAYKVEKDRFASSIRKMGDKVSDIIKNSGNPLAKTSADTLSFVKQLAGDVPDPELQREIQNGQLGPASTRFLRGRMIYDQLDFVSTTGDWADFDLVDEAHPMFQQFQQLSVQAGEALRQRQQLGAITGITDLREANRIKRRIAAITMKELAARKHTRMAMGAAGGQQAPSSAPAAPGATNVQPQPPAGGSPQQQPSIGGQQRPFGPPR